MSYIVTARKWRPQLFKDVIGQRHVTETLQKAIEADRIGHAYLFSGPRGVGKTTVARIFAKALNCEHGPAPEPCNECPLCAGIQNGTSMDIQELDGASHNSVEDVRELISRVGYHSTARYKMYIIDEVHMLSNAAFNALLKTLEEPPANVIFIFATTEPQKLPPTILSRCQRYDFHRLSVTDIAGKLARIATADDITIDEASLLLIARRATGAMRDAESIFEQLKSSRGDTISLEDVTQVLGIAGRELFFNIMDRCRERDVKGAIELFTTYYNGGGDMKEFVEGLLEHLRDMLYACFEGGLDHAVLSGEMKTLIADQARSWGRHDIIRMIGLVTDVETSLPYAVLPVLRIEVALARMAALESTVQLKELFDLFGGGTPREERPAEREHLPEEPPPENISVPDEEREMAYDDGIETDDVRDESPAPAGEGLTVSPDIESLKANWQAVVTMVGTAYPSIGPSLALAEPVSFADGTLTLQFRNGEKFHQKSVESNAAKIGEVISTLTGTTVAIRCTQDQGGEAAKKTTELDDLIAREPIIGTIMDLFDGEIT